MELKEAAVSPFRLSLQTAVRLTFINTVNIADIRITRVSESYETERLNINTRSGEVFVGDPKRKFCEKRGEIFSRKKKGGRGRIKANYSYILSLSSAELGRNLHLARITE